MEEEGVIKGDKKDKDIVCQGPLNYLVKEDKWEKYFYVLTKEKRLRAYKDASMKLPILGPAGDINIDKLKDPYDISLADHLNDTHIFGFSIIFGPSQTIYMAAPTPNSRQEWMDTMMMLIRSKKQKNLVSVLADHLRIETTSKEDAKKSTDANMVEKAITAVEFDGLAELTLSGLKMREFPVLPGGSALAKRIPKVQAVDLSFNEFERIPVEVTSFKFLERVNMIGCKLIEFPWELRKCPKLQELNLQGNFIQKVPKDIGYFTALERLRLNNNKLVFIDDAIGCLKHLDELALSGNVSLTELPMSIFECKWLKVLDLSGCGFTKFPFALVHCRHLLDLNIANNKLELLPDDLGRLESLGAFNCADNHIQEMPVSLGLCSNLRSLENSVNIARNPFIDENLFEKLREGTNAFMDYMEEQMIDLYGAFPRYEPLADPPPRVLPPLPDDPQEVPLSQKQTSYGISKEVQDQMNKVRQAQAGPAVASNLAPRRAAPRSGSNAPPVQPGYVPPGASSNSNAPPVQRDYVPPQQQQLQYQQQQQQQQGYGTSAAPPSMDDLEGFDTNPPAIVVEAKPAPKFEEKSRLADVNSTNAAAANLNKLVNQARARGLSNTPAPNFDPSQRGARSGSNAPLPQQPPTQASPSKASPPPQRLAQPPQTAAPAPAPMPVVQVRDRKTLTDWVDTSLELMIAKLESTLGALEATSSVAELGPYVNMVKSFKPIVPQLNQFVMVTTTNPPPSDDKFVRARSIVMAGIGDVAKALESFHKWLTDSARPPPDDSFFAAADLVRDIKAIV